MQETRFHPAGFSCQSFPKLSEPLPVSLKFFIFCFLFFFLHFLFCFFVRAFTLSAPTQLFCLLLFLLFSAPSETLYCAGAAAVAAGVAAHLCKFHGGEALDFFWWEGVGELGGACF